MEKKEVESYVKQAIKQGKSKLQIKQELLQQAMPEDTINSNLINAAEPALLQRFKRYNTLLVLFTTLVLILQISGYILVYAKMFSPIVILALTLPIAILWLMAMHRSIAWTYPLVLAASILASLRSLIMLLVDPLAGFISLMVTVPTAVLANYCAKNIHPDYDYKHLFSQKTYSPVDLTTLQQKESRPLFISMTILLVIAAILIIPSSLLVLANPTAAGETTGPNPIMIGFCCSECTDKFSKVASKYNSTAECGWLVTLERCRPFFEQTPMKVAECQQALYP